MRLRSAGSEAERRGAHGTDNCGLTCDFLDIHATGLLPVTSTDSLTCDFVIRRLPVLNELPNINARLIRRQSQAAEPECGAKMDQLGIGFLNTFGLPPVESVELAAALGCAYMSTVVRGGPLLPLGYPPFSLRDDLALRRELLAAMDDHGVRISLGDGFLVRPGKESDWWPTDLDALADLGVPRINVVSLDPDLGRSFDQFASLTELAAERGIHTVVEPAPGLAVGDLATALAARAHVGRPEFGVLIDTMHLARSGSGAADLAAVDPDGIGYVQLCDTTLRPRLDNYLEEAMFERMVPGEGELPLWDVLLALPADVVIELEVPRRSLALAGVSPFDRLRPCVEAARRLLAEVQLGKRSGKPAAR
jgi:sugar phosphate isomerase/epimerase